MLLTGNYKRTRQFAYHKNFLQSYGPCLMKPITKPNGPKTFFDKLNSAKALKKFFGIPKNDNCRNIIVENNEFLVKSGTDTTNLIGKAVLVRKDAQGIISMYNDGLRPAHFWCPPEQKVFKAASFEVASKITIGSFLPKQYFKGIYNSTDGKISRPI